MTRKTSKAGPDQGSIAQAGAWLARVMSPHATLDDASALDAWLAEAPQNREAWRLANALWSDLGGMTDDPLVAGLRAEAAEPPARRAARPRTPKA